MYLYDSPPSGAQRGTAIFLGELGGATKREPVQDSTKAPYRWICALDVHFPRQDKRRSRIPATGFLISPRHIVTAARNLVRGSTPEANWRKEPGTRVDALKVTVTPALNGAPALGKKRAPAGSIDLKPPDWWMPNQYLYSDLGVRWDVAVLTLPKELPAVGGAHYGHWGDIHFSPRTSIESATIASLAGTTLTTCGYADEWCIREPSLPPSAAKPRPEPSGPVTFMKGWESGPWQTFGRVPLDQQPSAQVGAVVYDAAGCQGMTGAPLWLNTGSLRLVGVHIKSDLANTDNPELPPTVGVGLPLRSEILDVLRQRVKLAGLQPTF
jgi:hypothetical protein